jgi:hypothetical protein
MLDGAVGHRFARIGLDAGPLGCAQGTRVVGAQDIAALVGRAVLQEEITRLHADADGRLPGGNAALTIDVAPFIIQTRDRTATERPLVDDADETRRTGANPCLRIDELARLIETRRPGGLVTLHVHEAADLVRVAVRARLPRITVTLWDRIAHAGGVQTALACAHPGSTATRNARTRRRRVPFGLGTRPSKRERGETQTAGRSHRQDHRMVCSSCSRPVTVKVADDVTEAEETEHDARPTIDGILHGRRNPAAHAAR